MIKHTYGYKPDLFDHRDYKFAPKFGVSQLPPSTNNRAHIDWIYDQGAENSCVAQSSSSLIRYVRKQQNLPEIDPSRSFIYWCGRVVEGDQTRDQGMQIRTAMQVLSNSGYCSETLWGYYPSTIFAQPAVAVYDAASHNLVAEYVSINQNHADLKSSLAEGKPFVFGMEVFTSMESAEVAQSGFVPMPTKTDEVLGAHAVLCVDYDDSKEAYFIMNSWGSGWGQKGFFWLPYNFIESQELCSDFWTINSFRTIPEKTGLSNPTISIGSDPFFPYDDNGIA
jgi:C1A family cysteine protease